MKKAFKLISLFSLVIIFSSATPDSLKLISIESRVKILQDRVDEVKRDQINYTIEKDLIKDTYKNNFEKLNFFLTAILAIFGLLGFLGLRDINSIKKEYKDELKKLQQLQIDLESKSKDFENYKVKYDNDIKQIVQQNEEQNRKLKILELKDKISNLFKEKQYSTALEFTIVALEIAPNDIDLILQKARIYTRIRKYDESIKSCNKIIELAPENSTAICDLAELYFFSKAEDKADKLIEKHPDLFNSKINGELLNYFELIRLYNSNNLAELKPLVLSKIDKSDLKVKKERLDGWDVYDALIYVFNEPDSDVKTVLLNYLWYIKGDLNANELLTLLGEKVEDKK